MKKTLWFALGWCCLTLRVCGQAPEYKATRQVEGILRVAGSPQMGDLLKIYEAGFRQFQPGVEFEQTLDGTVAAVGAIESGNADVGLLGREIWPEEEKAFAEKKGYAPWVIDVATGSYDVPKATFALMVFVSRDNPLTSISTGQLTRIFGEGREKPIETWGEVGLKGEWAARPVHLYGFSVTNDKARIFAQSIFTDGERWTAGLHEFANDDGIDAGELIVRGVAGDKDGIGISNVHYATASVKALALSTMLHPVPIAATRESVAARVYPLTREVYMVLDKRPSPAVVEFLRYVLSMQGQLAVVKEGNYLPLPDDIARQELSEAGKDKK
jgi:phosphate transport system substrate-binding protein